MKVKYSALVSDMRNKLNGSVAAKNRYGSYLRNKVSPVNRQTSAQTLQRQQFGSLSAGWRGLTQDEREAWNASAINYPRTDVFGDSKILSGQALYISLNRNLFNAGAPAITSPRAPGAFPTIGISTFDASALELTVTPGTIPAGYKLLVFATPPISQGREFVKNLFKLLSPGTPITVGTGGVIDLNSAYEFVYGPITQPGSKVAVKVVAINTATGEASAPVTAWSIL